MKRFAACLLLVACSLRSSLAADSIVVFNEIHYHPATNEAANEWVELHNQMAVDIDLSAWSIQGGIGYTFPENTIIPAGGNLELRDRNDRLMDKLEYRDTGKWPVAPGGSGATLAKRDPNSASETPEN